LKRILRPSAHGQDDRAAGEEDGAAEEVEEGAAYERIAAKVAMGGLDGAVQKRMAETTSTRAVTPFLKINNNSRSVWGYFCEVAVSSRILSNHVVVLQIVVPFWRISSLLCVDSHSLAHPQLQ
jgi:hypothetical protein